MMNFVLDFKDLDPSLNSSQTVEYDSLAVATEKVTEAIRDIVADHVRHGKVLTMVSVLVLDDAGNPLTEIMVADALRDLLPGLWPIQKA